MTQVVDPSLAQIDLESKYRQESGRLYLTGLQALVRVPLDQMRADRRQGRRSGAFVSGYPGSPLAGFDLELGSHKELLDDLGVIFQPGLNEELGATAVMGSQIAESFGALQQDGVVGIWYGKAPGLDRAADAIRHANYSGTTRNGGVLAYVGDDPTCKSSSIPNTSDGLLADLSLPTLYPGTIQEVLDFGLHGIAMSRISSLWTGFKVVAAVADGAGTVLVDPSRVTPILPVDDMGHPLGQSSPSSLSPLTILDVEREIYETRLPAAEEYGRLNRLNEITTRSTDDWLGLIAPGHLYYEAVEALRQLGLADDELSSRGIRLLRIGMINPLDRTLLREFAHGLSEIIVIEDKRDRIERLLKEALYGHGEAPQILGKRADNGRFFLPAHGALDADILVPPLYERLSRRIDPANLKPPPKAVTRIDLPILGRTPYFCSGCPHNTSARVPEGSKVGAGIGCHSMVAFMAPDIVGEVTGVTQMGGEGTQWIGARPFVDTDHIFQNLGDGTFFHSGEMAVRASVAAGAHITYKILYNRAVAMTGGQDAEGALDVPQMASLLTSIGVNRIIVTTEDKARYRGVRLPTGVALFDREKIIEAQEILRRTDGVTVLIHDQQCAAEARRLRKRGKQIEPATQVLINERVCEGCGDCGRKSNCLSVRTTETEFGPKTTIDQSSCNKDYSCLNGDCPSFIAVEPRRTRRLRLRRSADGKTTSVRTTLIPPDGLREPDAVVDTDDFRLRMPGIGGTGVVTVAQIIGTAALLAGRYVSQTDQTGLAQKGGAVVSDLRITATPLSTSAKIPAASVDLYLAFDMVVALSPANLASVSSERSVVVGSSSVVPTGQMIGTSAEQPHSDTMIAELNLRTRSDLNVFADTTDITNRLFGRSTTANIFALGIAYQLGALPIPAEHIHSAIKLNGVAVEANNAAFKWGRWYVQDKAVVEAKLSSSTFRQETASTPTAPARTERDSMRLSVLANTDFGGELGRLVAVRAPDLADYQDAEYARDYVALVRRVKSAEAAVQPGSTALSESVARNFYKLMAYKDEYEVARLHLEDAADAAVKAVAQGRSVKVSWYLHPPALRALGMNTKLKLGPWFKPAFVTLRSMRKIRGTPLDLFGMAKVRRVERRLVGEYRTTVEHLLQHLSAANFQRACEIAELPGLVRGYEFIKLDNVSKYDKERATLLDEFNRTLTS